MWTALQVDHAVAMFGQWVEGKLMERDDDHNPKHTLRDLLDLPLSHEELAQKTKESLFWLKAQAHSARSGIKVVTIHAKS